MQNTVPTDPDKATQLKAIRIQTGSGLRNPVSLAWRTVRYFSEPPQIQIWRMAGLRTHLSILSWQTTSRSGDCPWSPAARPQIAQGRPLLIPATK
jgi:hypothetical protein